MFRSVVDDSNHKILIRYLGTGQNLFMYSATVKQYYRVDRRQIHFLKFILEGYDGMAVVRTLDPPRGLVVLHIGPGCQSVVDMIVRDLKKQIRIERVESTIEDGRLNKVNQQAIMHQVI